jgi:hypothetical protein
MALYTRSTCESGNRGSWVGKVARADKIKGTIFIRDESALTQRPAIDSVAESRAGLLYRKPQNFGQHRWTDTGAPDLIRDLDSGFLLSRNDEQDAGHSEPSVFSILDGQTANTI